MRVTVFGARGYTGLETCRLLMGHPHVSELRLVSNNKEWQLKHDLVQAERFPTTTITREEFKAIDDFDDELIFLACSAGDAAELAEGLLEKRARVIDLSGGHRLANAEAKEWYGLSHKNDLLTNPEIYGLSPFAKKTHRIVSNPGCYVTSILMALVPLLEGDLVESDFMVFDSKSGTSGAGRSPKDITHFSELFGSVHPYKVAGHQHLPEIKRYAEYYGKKEIEPRFTTTLLPIKRGILSTLYLKTKPNVKAETIKKAFETCYKDYPFASVHALEGGSEDMAALALRKVIGTNQTQISYYLKDGQLTVFSMIDNLMKGAAGQAVENMNRMLELPVETGLN